MRGVELRDLAQASEITSYLNRDAKICYNGDFVYMRVGQN